MNSSNRRNFLKFGIGGATALLTGGQMAKALQAACGETPAQTPGPFYPGETQFSMNKDLTVLPNRSIRATGQIINLSGAILDENCNPVSGATVEIWQACATGKYNNPNDPNPAKLDPNFSYWGETNTDASGRYSFKTIRPGAYPADTNWIRPPHIHFKITKLGFKELITQMYFAGEPLNKNDLIFLNVPASERPSVEVQFKTDPAEPSALIGEFDITIQKIKPRS